MNFLQTKSKEKRPPLRGLFYIETKIQKLHKGKACNTFPVLESKGKAANYRFAVGVNPVDSQVRINGSAT